eukprot:Rmarinus@m.23950
MEDASAQSPKKKSKGTVYTVEIERITNLHPLSRTDEDVKILSRWLREVKFLDDLKPRTRHEVIRNITLETYMPGSEVFSQGDTENTNFYIILEGMVECVRTEWVNNQETTAFRIRYGAGKSFGELALLQSIPRSASVKVIQETKLGVISKEVYNQCLKYSQEETLGSILTFLRGLYFFQSHPTKTLARVSYVLKANTYSAGSSILEIGEKVEGLYLVKSGSVCLRTVMNHPLHHLSATPAVQESSEPSSIFDAPPEPPFTPEEKQEKRKPAPRHHGSGGGQQGVAIGYDPFANKERSRMTRADVSHSLARLAQNSVVIDVGVLGVGEAFGGEGLEQLFDEEGPVKPDSRLSKWAVTAGENTEVLFLHRVDATFALSGCTTRVKQYFETREEQRQRVVEARSHVPQDLGDMNLSTRGSMVPGTPVIDDFTASLLGEPALYRTPASGYSTVSHQGSRDVLIHKSTLAPVPSLSKIGTMAAREMSHSIRPVLASIPSSHLDHAKRREERRRMREHKISQRRFERTRERDRNWLSKYYFRNLNPETRDEDLDPEVKAEMKESQMLPSLSPSRSVIVSPDRNPPSPEFSPLWKKSTTANAGAEGTCSPTRSQSVLCSSPLAATVPRVLRPPRCQSVPPSMFHHSNASPLKSQSPPVIRSKRQLPKIHEGGYFSDTDAIKQQMLRHKNRNNPAAPGHDPLSPHKDKLYPCIPSKETNALITQGGDANCAGGDVCKGAKSSGVGSGVSSGVGSGVSSGVGSGV